MTIKVEDDDNLTHQPRGFFPLVSDYDYDANGNMIKDDGKYLEIDYNLLNLPTYIFNTDTHDEMLFEYAFGGEKLKKVSVIDDTIRTRLYMGGFEFLDDEPEAFHHGEGRIVLTDSLPRFQFKIADHLGNTVVLFEDKDNSGTISTIIPQDPEDAEMVQRNLYYPFGMQLDGTWKHLTNPRADYLYNGKELEDELGLNWLAFGFRYADPAIGRFTGVDPIADQFVWVSPFNYAENEPVGHIDLWGLQKAKKEDESNNTWKEVEGGYVDEKYGGTAQWNESLETWQYSVERNDQKHTYILGDEGWNLVEADNSPVQTGTGVGLRCEYCTGGLSGYADGVANIAWDMMHPVLLLPLEAGEPVFGGYQAIKSWLSKSGSTASARSLGIAGERAVGLSGPKTAISIGGRTRIPDALTRTTLTEVKNVKHLSFTQQLRDFHSFAQKNSLDFILYTRSNTTFSGPLQKMINNRSIIHRTIPGL